MREEGTHTHTHMQIVSDRGGWVNDRKRGGGMSNRERLMEGRIVREV